MNGIMTQILDSQAQSDANTWKFKRFEQEDK